MRQILSTMIVVLACSGVAYGACPAPYTADALGGDLSRMSDTLRDRKIDQFQESGKALTAGMGCINSPMAPVILASLYRYSGLYAHFAGEKEQAQRWFRSALELDSSYDWDISEVAGDDPIRMIFEEVRSSLDTQPQAVAGGRELMVPTGARVMVDGRVLRTAALTLDRPHLVQVVDVATNSVVDVWLIQGNEFPDSLLGDAPVADAGPAPVSGSSLNVQRIERSRPPLKTPALIVGGVGLVAGVGLYAASFPAHANFESATTAADLEKSRNLTNFLVLGAGGAVIAGAAIGYVGVSLSGGPTIHWARQF
jgi:hypothetical protein